ncbi:hydrolase [Pseudonocardia sp. D17]|nr:hydrolase [Pseudonocardia sp. D17]
MVCRGAMSDAGRMPEPAAGSASDGAVRPPVTRSAVLAPRQTLPPLDLARRPWPGREITAGGVTLHVRETPGAAGARAVYVHGLSGSATNWTDLAGLLAPRAHGVAVDLPGFGLSRPLEPRRWTPAANADALAAFLRGAGDGPVHLLGNSLGGAVALLLAARHPDLVRTLTLISPAVPDLRPDPRRMSDPRIVLALVPGLGRRARRALARVGPRERAEQVVALCFGDPSVAPEHRLVEATEEIVARGRLEWAGEAFTGATFGMIAGWFRPGAASLWSALRAVTAPTLVVWGDRDRLVAPRHAARTVRSLRDGRLLMLPGVGHVAQIEAPEAVACAVAGMWDAVEAGHRSRDGKMDAVTRVDNVES